MAQIDKELDYGIRLMAEGKEEGFTIFYTYTQDFVYKRAKFIMKNEEDALDLTQEAFVQAYKNIASLKDVQSVYAWLGSIVYRQGMRIFRDQKELLLDDEAEGIFEDIVSEDKEGLPEVSADEKATVDIVKSFIDELPELQRIAVISFYYDNKKIDEIAEEAGCSSNTIKSRLNYAKKFLKDKVEEHEKVNGYKLHSINPIIIIYALKDLFQEKSYTMPVSAASKVLQGAIGSGGVATSSVATSSVVTTASTVAAKTGVGIGAKVAIGSAMIATTVVLSVGAMHLSETAIIDTETQSHSWTDLETETTSESVLEIESETESQIETETQEPIVYYDYYQFIEGTYAYSYSDTERLLVLTNVRTTSEDYNDIIFDIEYMGMSAKDVPLDNHIAEFTLYNEDESEKCDMILGMVDDCIHMIDFFYTDAQGQNYDLSAAALQPRIYTKDIYESMGAVSEEYTLTKGIYQFILEEESEISYELHIGLTEYNRTLDRLFSVKVYKNGELLDRIILVGTMPSLHDNQMTLWAENDTGCEFEFFFQCTGDNMGEMFFMTTSETIPEWMNNRLITGIFSIQE